MHFFRCIVLPTCLFVARALGVVAVDGRSVVPDDQQDHPSPSCNHERTGVLRLAVLEVVHMLTRAEARLREMKLYVNMPRSRRVNTSDDTILRTHSAFLTYKAYIDSSLLMSDHQDNGYRPVDLVARMTDRRIDQVASRLGTLRKQISVPNAQPPFQVDIRCGTGSKWLSNTDYEGRTAQMIWPDDRPSPFPTRLCDRRRGVSVNDTWVFLAGGRFETRHPTYIRTFHKPRLPDMAYELQGLGGEYPMVMALNPRKFMTWREVRSDRDDTANTEKRWMVPYDLINSIPLKDPHKEQHMYSLYDVTMEHPSTDILWSLMSFEDAGSTIPLWKDMPCAWWRGPSRVPGKHLHNDLDSAESRHVDGGVTSGLGFGKSTQDLGSPATCARFLAQTNPERAALTAENLRYLIVALYLQRYDWSRGYNLDLRTVLADTDLANGTTRVYKVPDTEESEEIARANEARNDQIVKQEADERPTIEQWAKGVSQDSLEEMAQWNQGISPDVPLDTAALDELSRAGNDVSDGLSDKSASPDTIKGPTLFGWNDLKRPGLSTSSASSSERHSISSNNSTSDPEHEGPPDVQDGSSPPRKKARLNSPEEESLPSDRESVGSHNSSSSSDQESSSGGRKRLPDNQDSDTPPRKKTRLSSPEQESLSSAGQSSSSHDPSGSEYHPSSSSDRGSSSDDQGRRPPRRKKAMLRLPPSQSAQPIDATLLQTPRSPDSVRSSVEQSEESNPSSDGAGSPRSAPPSDSPDPMDLDPPRQPRRDYSIPESAISTSPPPASPRSARQSRRQRVTNRRRPRLRSFGSMSESSGSVHYDPGRTPPRLLGGDIVASPESMSSRTNSSTSPGPPGRRKYRPSSEEDPGSSGTDYNDLSP